MARQKSIIVVLIVAVLAIVGYWFTGQTQTVDQSVSVVEPVADPAAVVAPESTTEPDAVEAETAESTTAPVQPIVDTNNWVCTAWQDTSGTSSQPTDETCIQWSVRRNQ